MDNPASYLNLGVISISYPNLLLIGIMILLFALALFMPFGHDGEERRR